MGTCSTLAGAAHIGAGPRRCTHRRRQGRDQEFHPLGRNAEIALPHPALGDALSGLAEFLEPPHTRGLAERRMFRDEG